jgi:hypothetical protein
MHASNKRLNKGLHKGLHNGPHKGLHKELTKGLHKEIRKELRKGLHTLVCQGTRETCSTSSQKLTTRTYIHSYMHTYPHTHRYTYIHIYTCLLETTWGPVGPKRAGRPQTASTERPGGHLGPCGPQPGRGAPNGLHRASWSPSGALWAPTRPGGPKRPPQSLLEAMWGSVSPNRAGRLQTVSAEPPGGHLAPCGPQPGREAPNA